MKTHADKTQENKCQTVANANSQKKSGSESTFQFVDNRPEAVAQRKLQAMADNSPQVKQLRAFEDLTNNSKQVKQAAQLQAMADKHSGRPLVLQKKENTDKGQTARMLPIQRLYVKTSPNESLEKVQTIKEPPEWKYGMNDNKHVAQNEEEAKRVTHARYISDGGGGGKRVRNGESNTVAEAKYWVAGVRTKQADVTLGAEEDMDVQPIGWEVKRTGERKTEKNEAAAEHDVFDAADYEAIGTFMPRKLKVQVKTYDKATREASVAMGHVTDQE